MFRVLRAITRALQCAWNWLTFWGRDMLDDDPTRLRMWSLDDAVLEPALQLINSPDIKGRLAAIPDKDTLRELIALVYWASLREEEGRPVLPSLVYGPLNAFGDILSFEQATELDKKLAPATGGVGTLSSRRLLTPPVSRFGMYRYRGKLLTWGFVRRLDMPAVHIRAVAPGRVTVEVGRDIGQGQVGFEKAIIAEANAAYSLVFSGKDGMQHGLWPPQCGFLLSRTFEEDLPDKRERDVFAYILLQLVDAMRLQSNGGTLLVVPASSDEWRQSIYVSRTIDADGDLVAQARRINREIDEHKGRAPDDIHNFFVGDREGVSAALQRPLRALGALAAVDGAMVMNTHLRCLGFASKIGGVKIDQARTAIRKAQEGPDSRVIAMSHPALMLRDDLPKEKRWPAIKLDALGGMRHQSAALLVAAHHGCLAIVSSQDGGLTVFCWSKQEDAVATLKHLDWLLD